MGLSKLGQMIAVGGAAVGGFMKGKNDAEDRAREEEDRNWKKEQQGRLRKDWDDQDRIRSFTDDAADFISKNTSNPEQGGPAVMPQSTPAAQDATPTLAQQAQQGANLDQMSAPQQAAEQPGLAEPTPQARPAMTPVSPAVASQMEGQSLEKRITQPKLPPQAILSLETLQGRDQKIAEGLAQLAAKHKVLPQYMEWSGKARQAADEGMFRASQALDQGDIEGAYKLFQNSGRIKLAEGNPRDMIVPVDDKGTYRLTLADGTKVERNINKMRDSLMSLPEYVKYTAENRKAALEERKAESEMKYRDSLGKKAEADARFTDGARTDSALAKGGWSGLQQKKLDEKDIQQHVKEAADVYSLPNMMGDVKPNIEVKGAYTRLARAIGPEQAPQIAAQIRDHAERAAADPKTGELNQELFAKKYVAGWQALNAELMNKTARPAGEMAKPAAEPAKAPSKEPAAKPAPSLKKEPVKTETLKAGSPEAAAESARIDKIREDRNAKRQAEQDAADEEARAKRKLKVAQAEKEATAVNSLYKR